MLDEVQRELVLPAPPPAVWEVVTGPGWLADEVQLELVPGGEAGFGDRTGWVEEVIEGERLVFWWSLDGEPASRVELTLESQGDQLTRLRIVESRPLEVLDVVGIPLHGAGGPADGPSHGPALLSLA
jgi:uncharacterized protein YndB with AHSA1/START domain